MTSDSNDLKTDPDEITLTIKENAATAEIGETSDVLSNLGDKLDKLEFQFEELGLARELQEVLKEYINDLKDEVADIRRYRKYVTGLSVVMSVSLFGLLLYSVVCRPEWFLSLEGKLQVSLLTVLGGASVFLMSLLLRGVYRSRNDRHDGDFVPEIVKVAKDTFQTIVKR